MGKRADTQTWRKCPRGLVEAWELNSTLRGILGSVWRGQGGGWYASVAARVAVLGPFVDIGEAKARVSDSANLALAGVALAGKAQ